MNIIFGPSTYMRENIINFTIDISNQVDKAYN